MNTAIPTLSLSAFQAGGASEAAFVEAAGNALAEVGFFILTDHGIRPETVDRAYDAARAFFTLPEEVKRRYDLPGLKGQRGFTSFGREHAKDHRAPDLKEFWHVGRELVSEGAAEVPANLWPEEVPAFRAAVSPLFQQLEGCALELLEAVALYLGEERGLIREMAAGGSTLLRIIHYPPIPPDADPGSIRAAPHEDINLITLLPEATASGLELLTREGEWIPIEAHPGEIIVDAGDMLQNLTNGVLKSTTHRVVNPSNAREPRFSMPMFVHPRAEANLAPLPGCIERAGGAPRHPALTAGQYLEQRLREIGLA